MQVPSVSITSIFKYSTQATPDSNEIPYAMAFDGPSDEMKDQDSAATCDAVPTQDSKLCLDEMFCDPRIAEFFLTKYEVFTFLQIQHFCPSLLKKDVRTKVQISTTFRFC